MPVTDKCLYQKPQIKTFCKRSQSKTFIELSWNSRIFRHLVFLECSTFLRWKTVLLTFQIEIAATAKPMAHLNNCLLTFSSKKSLMSFLRKHFITILCCINFPLETLVLFFKAHMRALFWNTSKVYDFHTSSCQQLQSLQAFFLYNSQQGLHGSLYGKIQNV